MRIGVISQWFDPEAGSAAIPGSVVRALQARGHQVDVVTGFPNYPHGRVYDGYRIRLLQRERVGATRVFRIPNYPSHDGSGARRALTYLAFMLSASTLGAFLVRRCDVVLVYSTSATVQVAGVVARVLFGRRYVLYVQDLWPDSVIASGMVHGPVARLAEWSLRGLCALGYRHASGIAVISPGMRDILIDRGVPPDKVVVVPNWVDEGIFGQAVNGRVRRPTFDVMYAGSIGDVQGLEVAIDALARTPPHVRLRLVGGGVAKESLRQRVSRLGLSGRVHFEEARPLAEMPQVMASADVQLVCLRDIPLFHATMPSKTQAILASGLPVVVSAPGDVADLVRRAGAGRVVAPGDVAELARALTELSAATSEELTALGAAGRRFYETELCSSVGSARLESVLVAAKEAR